MTCRMPTGLLADLTNGRALSPSVYCLFVFNANVSWLNGKTYLQIVPHKLTGSTILQSAILATAGLLVSKSTKFHFDMKEKTLTF